MCSRKRSVLNSERSYSANKAVQIDFQYDFLHSKLFCFSILPLQFICLALVFAAFFLLSSLFIPEFFLHAIQTFPFSICLSMQVNISTYIHMYDRTWQPHPFYR